MPDAVPEPAVTPPPGNPRFALFDGLRAIAAFSIVVTHASGLTNFGAVNNPAGAYTARLNSGVAIFFVISGFLLYRPFVAARYSDRPRPSIGRFWWRRALRILPAYWVALILLNLWPGLTDIPGSHPWRYFLLLQNLDRNTVLFGIGPAWSLAVEAEFYLLLPFLALALERLFTGRVRHELWVLGGLALASVAFRTWEHKHNPGTPISTTLPTFFAWFFPGMALAVLSVQWQTARAKPRWATWLGEHAWTCWLAAFAVLTLSTQVGLPRNLSFHYSERTWLAEHLLYGLFGALMVLPAVVGEGHRGWVQSFLSTRVMAWLGLISYGAFLYHLPIAPKLLNLQNHAIVSPFLTYTVVLLGVAAACGAGSYYLVERPLLRFKDARLRRHDHRREAVET